MRTSRLAACAIVVVLGGGLLFAQSAPTEKADALSEAARKGDAAAAIGQKR
jgi:hypothetical protein